LSAASVGLIFGLDGGVEVLLGSAAAASVARLVGLGRTLTLAHLLFGVFGMFLAFTVVWRTHAALPVVASEFAQLCVNAVYMVNRSRVSITPSPASGALGTTLIVTEPPGSVAKLAICQRSVPTSRSSTSTAALLPPAYSRSSFTGRPSPNLRMSPRLTDH
jgi:hypothetical protein